MGVIVLLELTGLVVLLGLAELIILLELTGLVVLLGLTGVNVLRELVGDRMPRRYCRYLQFSIVCIAFLPPYTLYKALQ